MKTQKIFITIRDFGTVRAELYPDMAPVTVANFLKLAKEDFYRGTIFHRVIPGFMIQGGGFDENFEEKRADAIRGEFAANGFSGNTLRHTRGVLSMARTNDPNSASSQFFIMHEDAPYLDGQYAAFGKVTEGLDVIDRIAAVPTRTRAWYYENCPVSDVVIETIGLDD